MSEAGEVEDVPPREECQRRVEHFASVTGTDEALAQFYLQDRDWNLEASVNAFFAQNEATTSSSSATPVCIPFCNNSIAVLSSSSRL